METADDSHTYTAQTHSIHLLIRFLSQLLVFHLLQTSYYDGGSGPCVCACHAAVDCRFQEKRSLFSNSVAFKLYVGLRNLQLLISFSYHSFTF